MKALFVIIILLISFSAKTQDYFQQKVNHQISVEIHPQQHSLDAIEKIQYYNYSPDTLHFIWFHLWPNAYKNDRTAFSEQLLQNDRTDFYFSSDNEKGYINQIDFRVNGVAASTLDHPLHQDIIKLLLPQPLLPGDSLEIETPFHVQLPKYFSRSGYFGDHLSVTQWYPKPALYDRNGWHEMPYLDQGEFFNEFGKYDVSISVPSEFIIAATGIQNQFRIEDSMATYRFTQDSIPDFAFFVLKNYVVESDTVQIQQNTVSIFSYHQKGNARWDSSLQVIRNTLRTMSDWVGTYPYPAVKLVQRPDASEDGMEYPMITLVADAFSRKQLETIIRHEVSHNWFQCILGSNEREFPWMDEGMNSYYDNRYQIWTQNKKAAAEKTPNTVSRRLASGQMHWDEIGFKMAAASGKDQPINSSSAAFTRSNYGLIAYHKTAQWMQLLESHLGQTMFDQVMRAYFNEWKFKHPSPEDFKSIAATVSGQDLDKIFELLNKKGTLTSNRKYQCRFSILPKLGQSERTYQIGAWPVMGFNNYDKFMPGMAIHDFSLPFPSVRFLFAPMYSASSKKINGIGFLDYHKILTENRQLYIGVSYSRFTKSIFRDSTGRKQFLQFIKTMPFIRLEHSSGAHIHSSLSWKTYFLNEQGPVFAIDSLNQRLQISYPFVSSYINRLQYSRKNNRVLYPKQFLLQADQSKQFIRFNVQWQGFFNYPKGGGLEARWYAGKFFYLQKRTIPLAFTTDRYHLNMTGPNGNEDYTYSDYFIGRNDFDGIWSQQIMIRDGGFKIRTDLLSQKIGKSDDWLTSINLCTSIPDNLNPLSVMPLKIPVQLFFDLGSYAAAWDKKNKQDKFLYEGGLQFSLFSNRLLIYAPLVYSKVYKDYVNSVYEKNKFLKTVSFSLNLDFTSFNQWLSGEF